MTLCSFMVSCEIGELFANQTTPPWWIQAASLHLLKLKVLICLRLHNCEIHCISFALDFPGCQLWGCNVCSTRFSHSAADVYGATAVGYYVHSSHRDGMPHFASRSRTIQTHFSIKSVARLLKLVQDCLLTKVVAAVSGLKQTRCIL